MDCKSPSPPSPPSSSMVLPLRGMVGVPSSKSAIFTNSHVLCTEYLAHGGFSGFFAEFVFAQTIEFDSVVNTPEKFLTKLLKLRIYRCKIPTVITETLIV